MEFPSHLPFRDRFALQTFGDECVRWGGCHHQNGIGIVGWNKTSTNVQRASYEVANGVALTRKQVVKPKCGRRDCWNPNHLFVIPKRADIVLNSKTIAGKNVRKMTCPSGHEYTRSRNGRRRSCIICETQRPSRQWAHRKQLQRNRKLALDKQT